MPVSFDFSAFDAWFQEEVPKMLIQFMKAIAAIEAEVDSEINHIETLDLGESMVDRMTRDIKASAYDRIEQCIGDII